MSRTIIHNPLPAVLNTAKTAKHLTLPIARWITVFGCWNTPKPNPHRTVVPLPPIWYTPL